MAIDELLNEHEQSEQVRNWLRGNAVGLIGGVALGLAVIAGWNWWQGQRLSADMGVNASYAKSVTAFEDGKIPTDNGKAILAGLDKGNPTLATLAALQLAKAQVDAGKREDAIVTLRSQRNADGDLHPVVQVRLAHLLIDTGKAKDALALLGDERNAAMLDARGDAQFTLGDFSKAQEAYRQALALVDVGSPQHHLIAMKLIEAGGVPPHTEDKT